MIQKYHTGIFLYKKRACESSQVLFLSVRKLFVFLVRIRQYNIHNNSNQCCDYNRRTAENGRYPCWKCRQRCRCLRNTHTERCCQSYDGSIAVVHVSSHYQLHTSHGNGCKYRNRRSAQYALRNGSQQAENLGTRPAIKIIAPAPPSTKRFTTRVVVTIPTFWLKVAVGSPPIIAPRRFMIP